MLCAAQHAALTAPRSTPDAARRTQTQQFAPTGFIRKLRLVRVVINNTLVAF